jgi:hypothetical protein
VRPARRHLVWIAAAVLAFAEVPEAGAQAEKPEPVVGGGSFNTAPVLEPGRYSDSTLTDENTFYRVELQKGQRLEVETLFDTSGIETDPFDPGFQQGVTTSIFGTSLYTPLRQGIVFDNEQSGGSLEAGIRVSVRSRLALGYEDILDGSYTSDDFVGPGAYYIRLYAEPLFDPPRPAVEIPTEIDIQVKGAPQESSPDFTPELIPEDRGGGEGSSAEVGGPAVLGDLRLDESADARQEDTGLASVVVIGAYALLGGVALGALGARIASRPG